MTKKEILITSEGLQKLEAELKELTEVKRPEVVGRIKTAKELGDLSENAEYVAAKEDQSFIEGRIQEIEQTLKYIKVADNHAANVIGVGSQVKIEVEGDQDSFEIVGATESDPAHGKISLDSPVGRALLGHKPKDVVPVQTPDGSVDYKILQVS
ncbi:MAG TPA: transcription elongation factor GreA [Candidatus Saccharimonadales bacterium]|nr:transcription elongation factor GreA [Candidatus Saccharimonadales bacterium]